MCMILSALGKLDHHVLHCATSDPPCISLTRARDVSPVWPAPPCPAPAEPHMPCPVCPSGALGGRLDHTLSSLNVLHTHSHMELALIGELKAHSAGVWLQVLTQQGRARWISVGVLVAALRCVVCRWLLFR